jgi:hypothetical protein
MLLNRKKEDWLLLMRRERLSLELANLWYSGSDARGFRIQGLNGFRVHVARQCLAATTSKGSFVVA